MKMMCLISFHWILSFEYSSSDNIYKIYEVESKDWYGSSNLSSSNDSKCCNKKSKHNSSRISHNHFSGNIRSSKKIGNRNNNSEYTEKESTIFLTCYRRVSQIEFECETTKNNETNKSKTTSKTRNSIRKIYSIKNHNVPYNGYNNWYPIDTYGEILYLKTPEPFIKRNNSSENMAHIGDFYARKTDNCPDPNLHYKSCNGWYFYITFSDSIKIIDEWDYRYNYSNSEDDDKSFFEEWRKISKKKNQRTHQKKCNENGYACSVWGWVSSFFALIEMRTIKKSSLSEKVWCTFEYKRRKNERSYKKDSKLYYEHGMEINLFFTFCDFFFDFLLFILHILFQRVSSKKIKISKDKTENNHHNGSKIIKNRLILIDK